MKGCLGQVRSRIRSSSCAVYVGKTVVTSMAEKKGDGFGKFEVILAILVGVGCCG
jgi:hypothetical protein